MSSITQKALILPKKYGKFEVGTVPIPKPGPGELLIKVQAASLNPVDWKIAKHGLFFENYPIVIGWDIAGEVYELGEGVSNVRIGDRIFSTIAEAKNTQAGYQQYSIVRADGVARVPHNLTFDDVATVPIAFNCAYIGFYCRVPHGLGLTPPVTPETQGIYKGTPIVIIGGGSIVGFYAIQLARLSGFSPIITTADARHEEDLKAVGATVVIDRSHPSMVTEIKNRLGELTSNPLMTVFDSVSFPETQQLGIDILAPGGKLALSLERSESLTGVDDKTVIHARGFFFAPNAYDLMTHLYRDVLPGLLEKGIIKTPKVEVLPGGLAGVPDGLERLERGEVRRIKLIARPQETA